MDTLVLSQSYQPIGRVSWQRAMTLFVQDKIEVIEEYEDREVRSVTVTFKMPSIVRFLGRIRRKKQAVKFSRENVYTRDKGRCQYCLNKIPRGASTYDHVLPRRLGGRTVWTNIVISCGPCNQKKGGRTPQQAKMRLKTKPIKPKNLPNTWRLTFAWQDGMPLSWKDFMASVTYWNSELSD